NLQRVEAGFNQQSLLLFSVDPGLIGYKDERLVALYNNLAEHIEALPGVRAVTFSRVPLLSESTSSRGITMPGSAPSTDPQGRDRDITYVQHVRENFFEA